MLSKVFFKNLVYAGILAIILVAGLWFWLGHITDHGESITVPPLKGLSLDEAVSKLNDRGLEHMVVDSIWSEDAIGGTIVEQIPHEGKEVKENRKILLTIYRYAADAEKLGIKEGEVAEVAMIKLRNKGIYFDTEYESNMLMDGMVIRVEKDRKMLEPTTEIRPGEKVKLVIGKRSDEKVLVPSFIGLSRDSAEMKLGQANLSLGSALYIGEFESQSDSVEAVVTRQSPKANPDEPITIGSAIDLWFSKRGSLRETIQPDSLISN